jgi:uncharacterized protein YndB with AHSA1/START domain
MTSIQKSIHVDRPVDVAFKVFTEEIGAWWPLKEGFSFMGAEEVEDCIIEGHVGGRVVERGAGGKEFVIGTVTAWDPPSRVAFTWPHSDSNVTTEVDVRFTPDGDRTLVELEHRGWERLGDAGAEERGEYEGGWDFVLSKYVDSVGRA